MTDPTGSAGEPQGYAAPQPAPPLSASDDKTWATLAHVGGVLGFLPSLLIFLILGNRGTRTREESREALNWQITWIVAAIVLRIVVSILQFVLGLLLPYPADALVNLLLEIVAYVPYIANVIFSILGAVRVNAGGSYRYPFAVRLIK